MADARGRAREPLVLQLPHQLREPLPRFATDQVVVGDGDVVERDLGGVARSTSRACRGLRDTVTPGSEVSTMKSDDATTVAGIPAIGLRATSVRKCARVPFVMYIFVR